MRSRQVNIEDAWVRHDDEALEQLCARAWPAVAELRIGGWRARTAGGFTGRANSTLLLGSPDMPVPDALAKAAAFAREHGQPPRAHVITGSRWEPSLVAAGWRLEVEYAGMPSLVQVGPLDALVAPHRAEVRSTPWDAWWPLIVGRAAPTPAEHHVLTSADAVGYGAVTVDGSVLAVVRGAVVEDYLHFARLTVHPDARRRGLARDLLAGLATWAQSLGAQRYVLQVSENNAPAIRLYQTLGAHIHHGYCYWIPS
ncbi:GNAT family N-acetyltransferase [Allokutzneria sp. A3M-2-11 16]|uniref:GNAT family N-acetyltransferase n=1 Tax=Allokutzneria sp. A3M-2-11 16 TaxID=2962043 RepID=UPI0020B83E07|nr:GNAT family N-acetyltransferase [Allokutzneria sp. A3M-2-11 16]MCP3798633.1 GNAT family N-acetyltransferase [Allokutzneria sp. A3M-2-11 16]